MCASVNVFKRLSYCSVLVTNSMRRRYCSLIYPIWNARVECVCLWYSLENATCSSCHWNSPKTILFLRQLRTQWCVKIFMKWFEYFHKSNFVHGSCNLIRSVIDVYQILRISNALSEIYLSSAHAQCAHFDHKKNSNEKLNSKHFCAQLRLDHTINTTHLCK